MADDRGDMGLWLNFHKRLSGAWDRDPGNRHEIGQPFVAQDEGSSSGINKALVEKPSRPHV